MAMVSGVRSSLNPNAPLFIPASVRQVEDFSPEWWNLVTTSTWFRDYWLSQHQAEEYVDDFNGTDVADLLPDTIDLGVDEDILNMEAQFEEFLQANGTGEGNSWAASKGVPENGLPKQADALIKSLSFNNNRSPRSSVEPRHWEKPAKIISPKCNPRLIQQPR